MHGLWGMGVDDAPMPALLAAPVAPMSTDTLAPTDPCPGASQVGQLPAWQHSHGVRCTSCGHLLRFAWWGPGHLCGRCYRERTP